MMNNTNAYKQSQWAINLTPTTHFREEPGWVAIVDWLSWLDAYVANVVDLVIEASLLPSERIEGER